MKKIIGNAAISFFVLFLSACSGQLRKPLCENSIPIPDKFLGTYKYMLPDTAARWSSNQTVKEILVHIERDSFQLNVPLQKKTFSSLCYINLHYYFNQQNANGTYSVSEISETSQGLAFSILSLDLDQAGTPSARASGALLYYLPSADTVVLDSNARAGLVSAFVGNSFTLDNQNLTIEQTLSILKPISAQLILQKVDKSKFKEKSRIDLLIK